MVNILNSLNFTKIGDSFVLEPIDNILINQILRVANRGFYKEYDDVVIVKLIIVKLFDDKLNIKIKYDTGNSEFTMQFENNFDAIFLETLRIVREKKLNKIGI